MDGEDIKSLEPDRIQTHDHLVEADSAAWLQPLPNKSNIYLVGCINMFYLRLPISNCFIRTESSVQV